MDIRASCSLRQSGYLAFTGSGGLAGFNTQIFDRYQQIKPRVWAGSDITIVDIDEASIQRDWPMALASRTIIAELTDKLGEMGAAAIVFDVVFAESDRTSPLKALDELTKAGIRFSLT